MMDLIQFGSILRKLRKNVNKTQKQLAKEIGISTELVSIWERAYTYKTRTWVPHRVIIKKLIRTFKQLLTPEDTQEWLALIDMKLSPSELAALFGMPTPPLEIKQPVQLKHLPAISNQTLFGIAEKQKELQQVLEHQNTPWIIAIDGIGGIGKTSLANALVQAVMPTDRFYRCIWVSAKQEQFVSGSGIELIEDAFQSPVLDKESLTDALLEKLDSNISLTKSAQEKWILLTTLLKKEPYLIVIDNLESVTDYKALIPVVNQLANPSKIIITTRNSLQTYTDIYCLSLSELTSADAFAFLRYEAKTRGVTALTKATDAHLKQIYDVVGGNPLALKLVVGQIGFLPLTELLDNLKEARGKQIDELYSYIYWQAWKMLDDNTRSLLVAMPLVKNGTHRQLAEVSNVQGNDFNQALSQLIDLSLVEVQGDIDQPRYGIHRLTETFLLIEVIEWKQ